MAIIDIVFEVGKVVVMFESDVPPALQESGEIVFATPMEGGGVRLSTLPSQYYFSRVFIRAFPEAFLSWILPQINNAYVGYIVDEVFTHGERVRLHENLLMNMYDPIKLSTSRSTYPNKPGKVAIFTQSFNEGEMLLCWERHHAKLVGHENLYVLDNGGTDGSCALLNEKTTVVSMPAGAVDHENFAHMQGYFQRFLLQRYEWVIKIDTDELIAVEGDLLETLASTKPGIYKPGFVVAPIHDREHEAPFDFTGSVSQQRKYYVHENPLLKSPTIASCPISWSGGNHLAYEGTAQTMPDFWIFHLKQVDFGQCLERNQRWAAMQQTERDAKLCGEVRQFSDKTLQELADQTAAALLSRLAEEKVDVPAWALAKI